MGARDGASPPGANEFIKNLDEKLMEIRNFLKMFINYQRNLDFQESI